MTWAEFQIRLYAYNRMQKREDFRFREVAWAALTGFHSNPKRMPKTKDAFWKIDFDKPTVKLTDAHKEAFFKAQKQYLKELEDAKNRN